MNNQFLFVHPAETPELKKPSYGESWSSYVVTVGRKRWGLTSGNFPRRVENKPWRLKFGSRTQQGWQIRGRETQRGNRTDSRKWHWRWRTAQWSRRQTVAHQPQGYMAEGWSTTPEWEPEKKQNLRFKRWPFCIEMVSCKNTIKWYSLCRTKLKIHYRNVWAGNGSTVGNI